MLRSLILYVSRGTYSLMSTSNNSFLRNFFTAGLFYSQSFCLKSTERKSLNKYFFLHISFWCLTWATNPGFTSNKPTHYLLDYGGFNELNWFHLFSLTLQTLAQMHYMMISLSGYDSAGHKKSICVHRLSLCANVLFSVWLTSA